jgi:hypothetical protein
LLLKGRKLLILGRVALLLFSILRRRVPAC